MTSRELTVEELYWYDKGKARAAVDCKASIIFMDSYVQFILTASDKVLDYRGLPKHLKRRLDDLRQHAEYLHESFQTLVGDETDD